MIKVCNPAFDDVRKRAAFGPGAGREVTHQLCVEVAGLAAGTVQAALERDISLRDDELSLECDGSRQIEEEALTGPISADDESNACPALFDPLKVGEECADLVETTDLKMAKPNSRNDTGSQ